MTILELVADPAPHAQSPFDAIKQTREDGSEFWSARDLQPLLGYDAWRNFAKAIEDAQHSTEIVGAGQDQFVAVNKMITLGKGATRAVADFELTRYGAHMVAAACDGRKPEVAEAKNYFVRQTNFAERVQSNSELLSKLTATPRALSASEVGTYYAHTLDAFKTTITPATADTATAHALAYSMQEFARLMTFMVKEAAGAIASGEPDTLPVEHRPEFAIGAPTGSPAPFATRDGVSECENTRLPDFYADADDYELVTWAAFAKEAGVERCMRCGQGLSRRVMNAATSCGTPRGRSKGHSVFPSNVWAVAWDMWESFYTGLHNDPARNHTGDRA